MKLNPTSWIDRSLRDRLLKREKQILNLQTELDLLMKDRDTWVGAAGILAAKIEEEHGGDAIEAMHQAWKQAAARA
jgi:hypothetical protein